MDQITLKKLELPEFQRIIMFTDIHWGARNNSQQHNEDCFNFINWFKDKTIKQKCDAIYFLGDWFENRNAINTSTLNYSLNGLRLLNELNIPIILLVGNHDLYHRNNRDIHSAEVFKELNNVYVIEEPTKIGNDLLLPFLFNDEYPMIAPIVNKSRYVFGHLEFCKFFLTGTNQLCENGYSHKLFNGPIHIFSGHYHKRQVTDNVIYIGNPFATNYADANDLERGCCILETKSGNVDFIDYDGPTFLKTKLSKLLTDEIIPKRNARVRCLVDIELSYSEAQQAKSDLMELYELRELVLEENTQVVKEALQESILELDELDLSALDTTIIKLIEEGIQGTKTITPHKLAEIYKGL